jgi:hypothetical protein
MSKRAARHLMNSGILFAGCCLAFSSALRAQAGPGPIRPPVASEGSRTAADSEPDARPEPPPPQKKDLFATWRFNIEQSDDSGEKVKEARSIDSGTVASPRGGGGGNGGNGTGIHMGGVGQPYPGGNGGPGGRPRNGGNSANDADLTHQQMQELMNPADSMTFTRKEPKDAKDAKDPKDPKDAEVDMTDNLGRKRVFYTDDRKVDKSKDDKYQELDAHWEDYRLVSEQGDSHTARVTRSFEPAPGGKQMYENVRIERTRSSGPVEIRYVYDLVPSPVGDNKTGEKKP